MNKISQNITQSQFLKIYISIVLSVLLNPFSGVLAKNSRIGSKHQALKYNYFVAFMQGKTTATFQDYLASSISHKKNTKKKNVNPYYQQSNFYQQFKKHHEKESIEEYAIYDLLYNTYYKYNDFTSPNINNLKKNDKLPTCSNLTNESPLCFEKVSEYTIPRPNISEIIEIFCNHFENKLSQYDKKLCNTSNKKIKEKIKDDFPELKVSLIVQKYRVGTSALMIRSTNSTLIEKNNKSNYLRRNIVLNDKVKLENTFANCVKLNPKNFKSNCLKINNDAFLKLFKKTNIRLNHYYFKNYQWQECKANNLSLIKLFEKNGIYTLYPVFDYICIGEYHNTEKNIHDSVKIKITIDAMYGTLLSNSNKLSIREDFFPSNESDKKSENNSLPLQISFTDINSNVNSKDNQKIVTKHLKDMSRLFDAVLSTKQNKFSSGSTINVTLKEVCKKAQNYLAYSEKKTNSLCLTQAAINDKSIIFHEYGHLLISQTISHFEKNISLNAIKSTNISYLFHDFADLTAILVSNDDECFKNQVGVKNSNLDGFPRTINLDDAYNKNIPFHPDDEYKNGEIIAFLYQIALDELIKQHRFRNSENKIIPYTKHWIRFLRSIVLYDYNQIPCLYCDLDFYNAQQHLMNAYAFQLLESDDEKMLQKLFYEWAFHGYVPINSTCIDSKQNANKNCSATIKDENQTKKINATYAGLAMADILNADKNKFEIKVKTGFNFLFNSDHKLYKPQANQCSKHIEIEIKLTTKSVTTKFICGKDKVKCKIINQDKCIYSVLINNDKYKSFIKKNKSNDFTYLIYTSNDGFGNNYGSINKWYSNQALPIITIDN